VSTRPYDFIPCQHPEHPHKGRNTFHGPCQAKIDKEGNVCGWEPTEEERARVMKLSQKEAVVKVKGEPLKVNKETLGEPIVDDFMPREELAPPEGETATMEVDPASEVPGTIEAFEASNADEKQEPDRPGCFGEPGLADDAQCEVCGSLHECMALVADSEGLEEDDEDPTEEFDALPEEVAIYTSVPRRRYAVVDADTGEALQLSLLGAQWEDYRVKSERWSLSGGDETSQSEFEGKIVYRDRELRPGTVVEVVCRGYVKERAPIFKKDVYEGKTVIVVESLVEIELLGYRGGPIEVALNVDGEPKVYDEPRESESAPELETSDAVDWTGETEEAPDYEVVEDEDFFDPDGSEFGGDMFDNPGVEHEG